MSFTLQEAVVDITANTKGLSAGLSGAKKAVGATLSSLKGPLVAFGAAIAGAFAIKESVAAFAEANAIAEGLRSALEANGQEVDATAERWGNWADTLQSLTGISGEATTELFTLATNYGLTGDAAENAIKAAVGLSKAYGIDVQTALKGVTLEMAGNKSMLDKQIPALKGVTGATERLAAIQDAARSGMDQQLDAGQTLSGQWAIFKEAIGDVGEAIGELIAGGGGGAGLLAWITSWVYELKNGIMTVVDWKNSLIESFTTSAATSGTWLNKIMGVIDAVKTGFKLLLFSVANFELTWEVIAEGATNAFRIMWARAQNFADNFMIVGGYLLRNWKEIFIDIGNIVITVFQNVGHNIGEIVFAAFEYVRSGFTSDFEPMLKGVLEGFQSSLQEKLQLKAYVQPELENNATNRFKEGFAMLQQMEAEAAKQAADAQKAAEDEFRNITLDQVNLNDAEKKDKKKDKDKVEFISIEDAFKKLQASVGGKKDKDKVQEKQLTEAEKQTIALQNIEKKVGGPATAA